MISNLEYFTSGTIFIDSNIFIYANTDTHPLKEVSNNFLIRLDDSQIKGIINGRIIDEIYHKMLMIEVCNKYRINSNEALSLFKKTPTLLSEFEVPRDTIEDILDINNLIVSKIDVHTIETALLFSKYLLFSDAIHVATCKENGIINMATNDKDFGKIDFLNMWKP